MIVVGVNRIMRLAAGGSERVRAEAVCGHRAGEGVDFGPAGWLGGGLLLCCCAPGLAITGDSVGGDKDFAHHGDQRHLAGPAILPTSRS